MPVESQKLTCAKSTITRVTPDLPTASVSALSRSATRLQVDPAGHGDQDRGVGERLDGDHHGEGRLRPPPSSL
jgi:hypothetical protein